MPTTPVASAATLTPYQAMNTQLKKVCMFSSMTEDSQEVWMFKSETVEGSLSAAIWEMIWIPRPQLQEE